jgi:hypothetical protein
MGNSVELVSSIEIHIVTILILSVLAAGLDQVV